MSTSPLVAAWEQARQIIKHNIGQSAFDTWLEPLQAKSKDKTLITLEAPDVFFKEWVSQRYLGIIKDALVKICGYPVTVELRAGTDTPGAQAPSGGYTHNTHASELKNAAGPAANIVTALNPKYTFDNFIVGSANRFAHAASMAVAENPAKSYNPLFIYGGVGLGKTHLMQAICHFALKKYPAIKICYLPSERFTNELIDAIQHRSTQQFRHKYRGADILVIDDIHFIAGKESTQEEFFHTFNTLYDAHKQIIISSDRPPKEIAGLEERLVSRFSWGLITDIQMPDFETRVAILKKKIEREPTNVPDDVIFFIAEFITTNIRELEGALIRVVAYSLLEEKPITLQQAKEVLGDTIKNNKKPITVEGIQKMVADNFGVSLLDIKTRRRNKNIVLPRQVAMYISRELTEFSLPEIGEFFGGKDHTTVLHSYNKIKEHINKDADLRNKIQRLIKDITQ